MYHFLKNLVYPIRFFDDTQGGGGSNSNTTLTYNYGGEEITVDLSNPDQLKLVKDRLSKGHNMEKIAEERNKLKEEAAKYKETVDAWNDRLDAAKNDPAELKALIADLEEYFGQPLTKAEERQLEGGEDLDYDDPLAKKIVALEKRLAEQDRRNELREKQQEEEQTKRHAQELLAELDRMEKDAVNYPGFDREAVYNQARKDGTANFEMVYYFLNRDKFIDSERKKIEEEYRDLKDKRKAAATETDSSPANLTEPPKTFKRVSDVGKSLREDAKKGDLSFFTE